MSGASRAKRQAKAAAAQSEQARIELAQQTEFLRKQSEDEKKRANRLLLRSVRAAGGGFFETDSGGQTLGGTGVLG